MASYSALKKKGLSDDITVLVVDLLPHPDDKQPMLLTPGGKGVARKVVETCQVWKPLEAALHSQSWR